MAQGEAVDAATRWQQHHAEAQRLLEEGDLPAAEIEAKAAAEVALAAFGELDERTVQSARQWVETFGEQYDQNLSDREWATLAEREIPAQRLLVRLLEARLGPEHPDLADPLWSLGSTYWSSKGHAVEAVESLARALAIAERTWEATSERLIRLRRTLAWAHLDAGQQEQAERLLVPLATALGWDIEGPLSSARRQLAELYVTQGRMPEAERVFERILADTEAKPREGPYWRDLYARTLRWLAWAEHDHGRLREAEAAWLRTLETYERYREEVAALTSDNRHEQARHLDTLYWIDRDVGRTLCDLADTLHALGRTDEALGHYQTAVAMVEAQPSEWYSGIEREYSPPGPPSLRDRAVAKLQGRYGAFLQEVGRSDDAVPALARAEAVKAQVMAQWAVWRETHPEHTQDEDEDPIDDLIF